MLMRVCGVVFPRLLCRSCPHNLQDDIAALKQRVHSVGFRSRICAAPIVPSVPLGTNTVGRVVSMTHHSKLDLLLVWSDVDGNGDGDGADPNEPNKPPTCVEAMRPYSGGGAGAAELNVVDACTGDTIQRHRLVHTRC